MPNPFIKANTLLNYQNNALGQRAFIAAASDATGANSITNNVGYWDNASAFQTIFTPSAGAGIVRGVNSRDWEFFTDSVTADLKSWNIANGSSKWGIIAPTSAPGIASASGSTQPWTASTEFSTFGCIVDFNGNTEQLVGVNALGTNTSATLGTTSTGQPTWNQTSGGTTTDGTITWTNKGPVGVWKATAPSRTISTLAPSTPQQSFGTPKPMHSSAQPIVSAPAALSSPLSPQHLAGPTQKPLG